MRGNAKKDEGMNCNFLLDVLLQTIGIVGKGSSFDASNYVRMTLDDSSLMTNFGEQLRNRVNADQAKVTQIFSLLE